MGGTRIRYLAVGEPGASVESPPPPLRGVAGVLYWPGNWFWRWVLITLWVNDPRLEVLLQVLSGADRTCYKGFHVTADEGCLNPGKCYLVETLLLVH